MKKKLPTPQRLPSGMYRCQVMVDGKRISVVDEDPAVAQAKAVSIKAGLMEKKKTCPSITVGQAIDRYIESKDAVLSPSTVAGYKRIRHYALQDIMGKELNSLTQEAVQRSINAMSRGGKSPKSIRNAHGLLSAAIAEYRPDMILRTTMPQKVKHETQIPTDEEVEKIISTARGTVMELPVLLAVWFGLRVSEILGITWDSISGDMLHIKGAIVDGESGPVEKGTKTYSGDRKIRLPDYLKKLIEEQPKINSHIVQLSRRSIGGRFDTICKKAGVPHFRFHDLRHANASIMLALGIPDKYAMERMGHSTNNMLKTVYQHTMRSKQDEVADVIDNYFLEKLHTNLHIKKRTIAPQRF